MMKSKKEVVLVVEDEAILRFDAVDALEAAGIEALEAANAAEALILLNNRQDISTVFTDINMVGNIDGLALAKMIHARWPQIRVVVTSGHVRLRDGDLPGQARFVPKPYPSGQLAEILSLQGAPAMMARAG